MNDLRSLVDQFRDPKWMSNTHAMAFCDAHPDGEKHGRRSLSLTLKPDRLLVGCFNGCRTEDVVAARGLEMRDLFADSVEPMPRQHKPAPTLDGFCEERKLDKSRLRSRWRVREVEHHGRPALEYDTAIGVKRYKYLDGGTKNWWKGGRAHWYGLNAAKQRGGTLYIVNGEVSVWACDQHDIAAVCTCTGEGTPPDAEMVQELVRCGFDAVRVVFDRDTTGANAAPKMVQALKAGGVDAEALALPAYLGESGDVDDLQRWHGADLPGVLASLPPLEMAGPLRESRRDGDEFTFTFWSDLVRFTASHVRESHDDLFARISAESISVTGESLRRILGTSKLNVLSPQSRNALVKRLQQSGFNVQWDDLLEYVCETLLEEHNALDPIYELDSLTEAESDLRMLFTPLLPLGEPSVFYGPGGSMKSYLALSLAVGAHEYLNLAQVLPSEPLDQDATILYLDWETNAANWRNRLINVAAAMGVDEAPTRIKYQRMRGSLASSISQVRALASKLRSTFVIVDGISRACADNESAAAVNEFFDALDTITVDGQPVTRLILAHVTKAGIDQKHSKPFGSVHVENAARSTWELRATKNETSGYTDVSIRLDKANDLGYVAPIGLRAYFEGHRFTKWTQTGLNDNASIRERASAHELVYGYLLQHGEGSIRSMSEATGLSEATIKTALHRRKDAFVNVTGSANQTATWRLVSRRVEAV